jgi:hypothetical protein
LNRRRRNEGAPVVDKGVVMVNPFIVGKNTMQSLRGVSEPQLCGG